MRDGQKANKCRILNIVVDVPSIQIYFNEKTLNNFFLKIINSMSSETNADSFIEKIDWKPFVPGYCEVKKKNLLKIETRIN